MERVRLQEQGEGLLAGTPLSQRQLAQLAVKTPTADDILDSYQDLNEEINEQEAATGIPGARKEALMTLGNSGRPDPKVLARKVEVVPDPVVDRSQIFAADDDFDKSLDDLQSRVAAVPASAPVQVAQSPEDSMKDQLLALLAETPGAPGAKEIAEYKRKYGANAVYLMGFGPGDIYVYTHLKRGQWQKIQQAMATLEKQGGPTSHSLEDELKEKVLNYCIIWPHPLPTEFFINSRAGVMDRLWDAIMANSCFLSPQQTMMLTVSL